MKGEEIRKQRGFIPQGVLAEYTGIPQYRLSRAEKGEVTLTPEEVGEIRKQLTIIPTKPYGEVIGRMKFITGGNEDCLAELAIA